MKLIAKKVSFTFCILAISFSLIFSSILYPNLSFSQLNNTSQKYQVLKNKSDEVFTLPHNVTNGERQKPTEYVFKNPKGQNWYLSIFNNLIYSNNPEAKTIVKINEPYPSKKFIELTMFGNGLKRFFVAIYTNESGYMRISDNGQDVWDPNNPVTLSFGDNQGLSITNGKRIVVDKLSLDGFNLASIDVYGKDQAGMPNSTIGGNIKFETLSGDPSKSPVYYMPLVVMMIVGASILGMLKFKKRDVA